MNAITSPSIAGKFEHSGEHENYENVGLPLFVGLGMMIFSLVMAIVLFIIDKRSEQK